MSTTHPAPVVARWTIAASADWAAKVAVTLSAT